ncbi:2'-5' RNA ligase family protein [Ornithinibacillus bavariensis]|uniref:2'-5' RNA ligase family protein n=1 Tax=Ornithinibacillus bavariensis TaxID=545502 RepID=UPI000EEB3948|nr:2'-5' RNA ligase [Ornithinibacillus sp.]
MQYFIGIVPPESFKDKLIAFRGRWPNHRINKVVEPHITLKAQGGLTASEEWLANIINVCENFHPFRIRVEDPKFFFDNILFLSVESVELVELHYKIVQVVAPSAELIKQYYELDDYIPHMTLGKTAYGMTHQELIDMEAAVKEELSPYPSFEVNFIRVYKEFESEKYLKFLDIPLEGKR